MTDFEDLRDVVRAKVAEKRAEQRRRRLAAEKPVEEFKTAMKTTADEQITVGQLKSLLAEYLDDMLVQTEGCDCYGPCSGADLICSGTELLITRSRS